MKFNYAIFDFDMTLINSIRPLMISANLVAREFGLREVTAEEVYEAETASQNCTFESLWRYFWGRYDQRWYEAYRDHLCDEEYTYMELYPGGRETLEALMNMKVPLGMASNRDDPKRVLRSMELTHFFQAIVGCHDVERAKPYPDMINKAMELMGAPAEQTLYIGDSLGDIKAATAAGVKSLIMTSGGHMVEELKSLGAWKTGERLIEIIDCFRKS